MGAFSQPSLFTPAKQVAETSIAVYRETIVPTKETRQRRVLLALANCAEPPTSYELLKQMQAAGAANDVNDVRPRLSELLELGKVTRGDKRTCKVTGHTAFTWSLTHG
jgi:hypothetical protein